MKRKGADKSKENRKREAKTHTMRNCHNVDENRDNSYKQYFVRVKSVIRYAHTDPSHSDEVMLINVCRTFMDQPNDNFVRMETM